MTPDELRAKARAAGDAWLRGRMPTGVEPSADLYRIVDGMSEAMASAILPELDARVRAAREEAERAHEDARRIIRDAVRDGNRMEREAFERGRSVAFGEAARMFDEHLRRLRDSAKGPVSIDTRADVERVREAIRALARGEHRETEGGAVTPPGGREP